MFVTKCILKQPGHTWWWHYISFHFLQKSIRTRPLFFNIRLGQENLKTTYTAEKKYCWWRFHNYCKKQWYRSSREHWSAFYHRWSRFKCSGLWNLVQCRCHDSKYRRNDLLRTGRWSFLRGPRWYFWSWTNTRRRYRCRCAEGWIEMQNVHVIAIKAPISALQKTTKM